MPDLCRLALGRAVPSLELDGRARAHRPREPRAALRDTSPLPSSEVTRAWPLVSLGGGEGEGKVGWGDVAARVFTN
jgi:hypothetical protein